MHVVVSLSDLLDIPKHAWMDGWVGRWVGEWVSGWVGSTKSLDIHSCTFVSELKASCAILCFFSFRQNSFCSSTSVSLVLSQGSEAYGWMNNDDGSWFFCCCCFFFFP
jgi:hypothetical protein